MAEIGKDALDHVLALTDGVGVDLAIEAVGVPETFELCTDIVRAGGNVANVGVHGKPATLHLERLWIKDVTITTGLVDTCTTPRLMQLIAAGKLDLSVFATHRFLARRGDDRVRRVHGREGVRRVQGRAGRREAPAGRPGRGDARRRRGPSG